MAIKKIIEAPNEILINKAEKVKSDDPILKELIQDLIDTTNHQKNPEAAGLAAPQIGYPKRVCLVREFIESEESNQVTVINHIMINPKVISESKELEIDYESCLSIPQMYGKVLRPKIIKVVYQDSDFKEHKIKAKGFFARVILHEIDHLNGILFTNKIIGDLITEEEFDKLSEEDHD